MPAELFEGFNNWIPHDGSGMPPGLPDSALVKVMYRTGFPSAYVRCAYAWTYWTGGRDWWKHPGDERNYIVAYVVI